ncbi:hypothetical protein F4778DRAFT_76876 [Xylariomycetidae sp. FL2044]|nr:hypothetical protein F4778DRAFT_76876 [Xylariomycetidae sp. FL2044]
MRILCFHGRGSNNEVPDFITDTPSMEAALIDHTDLTACCVTTRSSSSKPLPFVPISMITSLTSSRAPCYTPKVTGPCSRKRLPARELYGYVNPVSPVSLLEAQRELERIVEESGPFDGCLGFCGGASIAAQLIIGDLLAHPDKPASERPFRFAVFINGATPFRAFRLDDPDADVDPERRGPAHAMIAEARSLLLRPSAVRQKGGDAGAAAAVEEEEQRLSREVLERLIDRFETRYLRGGQSFISDGEYGMYRYSSAADNGGAPIIGFPTLHVRDPSEDLVGDVDHGLNLWRLCDPARAREFHHAYGHDFPRGRREIRKISQLIRETAQDALII